MIDVNNYAILLLSFSHAVDVAPKNVRCADIPIAFSLDKVDNSFISAKGINDCANR